MSTRTPLRVDVMRGNVVESTHDVMVAVADSNGRVVNSWGNHTFLTFPRSAIKFLQAIPFVESGALEKFGLDDRHIALACASHKGEDIHLEVLKEWIAKLGLKEDALVCGPHWPTHEASFQQTIKSGTKISRLHNNCSGKHLGILSTCLALGESVQGYQNYEHNAQKRLRAIMTESSLLDHGKVSHGVDGCSIFTYAIPLQNVAVAASYFLRGKLPEKRTTTLKKIIGAVTKHPMLVSGHDDFGSAVMEETHGRCLVKHGAEGVLCCILLDKGIAFAVKAADGASRAAQVAAAAVLLHYGGLTETEYKKLGLHCQPPIKDWNGTVVGGIKVAAK